MAPAAARNRDPILQVLQRVLPGAGLVLELASGTGEHAVHFARALPQLDWQPSDADPDARSSIAAWVDWSGLSNLRPPIALHATQLPWPIAQAAAVLCINMIHIAPWAAAQGLVRGAAAVLPERGVLFLYGPYKRGGAHTAPSNQAFDASLRAQNPAWGVRDLERVEELAQEAGLALEEVVAMPANNLSLVFRRR